MNRSLSLDLVFRIGPIVYGRINPRVFEIPRTSHMSRRREEDMPPLRLRARNLIRQSFGLRDYTLFSKSRKALENLCGGGWRGRRGGKGEFVVPLAICIFFFFRAAFILLRLRGISREKLKVYLRNKIWRHLNNYTGAHTVALKEWKKKKEGGSHTRRGKEQMSSHKRMTVVRDEIQTCSPDEIVNLMTLLSPICERSSRYSRSSSRRNIFMGERRVTPETNLFIIEHKRSGYI